MIIFNENYQSAFIEVVFAEDQLLKAEKEANMVRDYWVIIEMEGAKVLNIWTVFPLILCLC